MSEIVWVLPQAKSKAKYHTSPHCSMPANHGGQPVEKRVAVAERGTPCMRKGPCRNATKAGPRPGRNRQMVTGGR
jgi:hypothetical protein